MMKTLFRHALALFVVLALALPALAQMFGPAVTVANVNLRNGPGTNHAVIRVLRSGEEVTIVRCERNWCLVNAGRDTGWVSQSYVARLVAAPPPPPPVLWPEFDFEAGPARACFYDRPNFRGASFCLRPGNGDGDLGNWRNRIASVAIHGNSLSVDLCTARNFRNCTSIRRDMPNVSRDLQGSIASVKVW